MKHLFTVLAILALTWYTHAQSTMIIEPGDVGTLNEMIEGDTMPDGSRMDAERIYILRRGFPYVMSGTLEFSGYHLQIQAEDGPGERPFILASPGDGGESASQLFRISGSGDLTFKGLHITGRDLLGNYNSRAVRINSENSRVTLDDCIIDEVGQSVFRVQGDSAKMYITNSLFTRIGRPFNPDNGRFIDNRGNPIDTLWVENTTVYNTSQRYYRNGGSNPAIGWGRFHQNTFYNTGLRGFDFGAVGQLQFTNNIVYNPIFVGNEATDQDTLADALFVIELDTFIPNTGNVVISNNNFHIQQELIDALPTTDADGDTIVSMADFMFDLEAQAYIDEAADGSNISEALTFDMAPPLPTDFIQAFHADTTSSSEVPAAMPWDMSNLTPDADLSLLTTGLDRYRSYHTFCYDAGAQSATAGLGGSAIGHVSGCEDLMVVSARDIFADHNILYFPNPVSDQLYIQNLENVELERVMLFDVAGRNLASFRPENIYLTIDMSSYTKGTYLITLVDRAGNVSSRKVLKQ